MTLSAPIGSLSSSQAASTPAPLHHRHDHDFGRDLAGTSGPGGQAAGQAASGTGQLLSSDLLQQIQTLAGQASSAIGKIG